MKIVRPEAEMEKNPSLVDTLYIAHPYCLDSTLRSKIGSKWGLNMGSKMGFKIPVALYFWIIFALYFAL